MKRAFVGLCVFVIVSLAVVVVAPGFMNWNGYKPQVREHVKNVSGLDLQLGGHVAFSFLPFPHLSIEDVALRAPDQQESEVLSLDKLEMSVALWPLLGGDVQVEALTIVRPHIHLEVLKDGSYSFVTQELKSLISAGNGQGGSASLPPVSLDVVRIKDGVFSYADQNNKTELSIQKINIDVSVSSILGPYDAAGSMFYEGKTMSFDVKADAFAPESLTLSLEINASVQPDNIDVYYGGAINFAEGFGGQGQFRVAGRDLAETLETYGIKDSRVGKIPYILKGLLSADAEKLDFKDFDLSLGQNSLVGSFDAKLNHKTYTLALRSAQPIDIKNLYPGAVGIKSGALNISASGDTTGITLHKSNIRLDDMNFSLSGRADLKPRADRPALALNIEADSFDYDRLGQMFAFTSKGKQDGAASSLKKMYFPQGLDLSFLSKSVRFQNQNIKDVRGHLLWNKHGVDVKALSVQDYNKADITVSGAVKNIQGLHGIDLNLHLNAKDAKLLAGSFGLDTVSWPQTLGQASIKAKLSGSVDQIDVMANIAALKGEIIAQGKIKTPLGTLSVSDLSLQLKHPSLSEAVSLYSGIVMQDRNFAKPLDFYAKVNQVGKSYKLEDIKGKLADASVQGAAVVDLSKEKPFVSGNLKFGKLVFNTIVNKSGVKTVQKGRRWSREPLNTQGLYALDANLTLSASSIAYGPWPLQAPQIELILKDGVFDITRLDAGLFDGTVSVKSQMSTAAQERQPLHINGQAKLNNVSIDKLVKALSGGQLVRASGKASVNAQIKSAGNSPAALVYDLSGEGTVMGRDIVLDGVDINRFARALADDSKPGDTVMGLWKGSVKGGQSAFETLDGNFVISEGVVDIQKLDLDGARSAIRTTGDIDLPRWTLATKHKVIVKDRDDVPPFDVSFSGSLDNPTQTFGQGLLQDYLSRKINRKIGKEFENLLSDKLGLPSNNNVAPAPEEIEPADGQGLTPEEKAAQNEPSQDEPQSFEDMAPEDAIKDVLKGLLQ